MISSDTCEYNFLELFESTPVEDNFILPNDISKNIQRIVGKEVDKQFILITAVLQITLSRYFQRKQVVVLSPSINSKNQSQLSSTLIPLVTSIESHLTLKEVVIENSENIIKAYRFQNYLDKKKQDIFKANLGLFCPQIHNKEHFENSCRYILEINVIEDETIKIKVVDKKHKTTDISVGFIQLFVHFLKQLQTPDIKVKSIPCYSVFKIKEDNYREIAILPIQESYPISDAQQGVWILSQFKQRSMAYHMASHFEIEANDSDISNLKLAIHSVIERHEALRTVFKEDSQGVVRQIILTSEHMSFEIEELDFSDSSDAQNNLLNYISEANSKAFDLESGPLLRVSIIKVPLGHYVFYYNMHHIISDVWSMNVLLKDVLHYYKSYKAGLSKDLPALRIQYKDYASWQLGELSSGSSELDRQYWLDSLSGEFPVLDFPRAKLRPRLKTSNGHHLGMYFSADQSKSIKAFSQERGGSLFMGLLSVWNILCYRYTGQEDVIVGSPVAGRDHVDLEDQVGFYENTLALRMAIDPEVDFNRFFEALKDRVLTSYRHQMYPFDRLVKELDLRKDTSRSAVFDVLLTLQNVREASKDIVISEDLLGTVLDQGDCRSKFDMELTFEEVGGHLHLGVTYNSDVYEKGMVEGLMVNYGGLMDSLLSDPTEKIGYVTYLSNEEQYELLNTFNDTKVSYPNDKTIVALFEQQVAKTPDAVALVFDGKEMTYSELNKKSNQLAHYLRKKGVKEETLVAICLDHSLEMIISLLGVLKSGGAYVPIDPSYPEDRIVYSFKNSAVTFLISSIECLPNYVVEHTVLIDRDCDVINNESSTKVVTTLGATNLAYVIYTSGSSGKPKGVLVTHQNVVRLFKTEAPLFDFDNQDVWTMFHSFCFDFSVWEMYGALFNGGRLIIIPRELAKDSSSFSKVLEENEVTVLNLTPTAFSGLEEFIFLSDLNLKVRYLIFGGESLNPGILRSWKDKYPDCKLINMYGITETTVHVTYKEITETEINSNISVIGKPIPTLGCYVLDAKMQLVPRGVFGELYVSGAGVSRGYLNAEDLTKERFLRNPFDLEGGRIYKTGDIVKWNSQGDLVYQGRNDDQVKIRGHRIELGEIKHVLESQAFIEHAVVLSKGSETGEQILVCYIVSESDLNIEEIQNALSEQLPSYMLPSHYIQLPEIPLTSNGKVDKRGLLATQKQGMFSGVEYLAPRNEMEFEMVKIWEEVLNKKNIGVFDNFFVLGGNSIRAMQIMQKISENFEIDIQIIEIFNFPLLADISAFIDQSKKRIYPPVLKAEELDKYPLSSHQKPLWLAHKLGQKKAYNSVFNFKVIGNLDVEILTDALNYTIVNNEILRTVIIEEMGEPFQIIKEDINANIGIVHIPDNVLVSERLTEVIKKEHEQEFDLNEGPLFRLKLLFDGQDYIGVFTVHHIIFDARSLDILLEEVLTKYKCLKEGIPIFQNKDKLQFKDFSSWYNKLYDSSLLDEQKKYWFDLVKGYDKVETLSAKDVDGRGYMIVFDSDQTNVLEKIAKKLNISVFSCLYAMYQIYIYKFANIDKLIIGTPGSIRINKELDQIIGYFVNLIPLNSTLHENMSLKDVLSCSNDSVKKSLDNRLVSLNIVINELRDQYGDDFYPFDTTMTYVDRHDTETVEIDVLNEKIKICPTNHETVNNIARFNMEFIAVKLKNKIQLQVIYKNQVYSTEDVIDMEQAFFEILELFSENINVPLIEIEIGNKKNISNLTKNTESKLNVRFN